MDECNGNNFRFPLKTYGGAERIVDKVPCHLDHFLQLCLVAFQAFGIFHQETVRMLDLQIEFDGLQENAFQRHHLLLRIVAKRFEFHITEHRASGFDDVQTLFRCFFHFAREK